MEEDESGAIYEFGPAERILGTVLFDKNSGAVNLIEMREPERESFYLSRI